MLVSERPGASVLGKPKHRALVVDDQFTNRLLLRSMLEREGYEVIEADDGAQGVEVFKTQGADIIFMDVMMPNMDGYEATKQIKSLSGSQMIPVFFLTALTDEQALAKCIESGGDDFLSKPFNRTILKARVAAIERSCQLYHDLEKQHCELSRLHAEIEHQHELAEKIFSSVLVERNPTVKALNTLIRPAARFSGDVCLLGYREDGSLDIFVGDFTGHGLSAAIGALPLADVFRAMLEKGFRPSEILDQINVKLNRLLPTGMFLAACYVNIQADMGKISVWNAGMPEVLLIKADSSAIAHRFISKHLPLGVQKSADTADFEVFSDFKEGDHLLMYSDGVLEARNLSEEMFGDVRLCSIIEQGATPERVFSNITRQLDTFCAHLPQDDDITLIDIRLSCDLFASAGAVPRTATQAVWGDAQAWHWFVELRGPNLRVANPVMLALDQLKAFDGIDAHLQPLYLVISELFNNALEHGVLHLDSKLKDSADGFSAYYEQRERRLSELEGGYVWLGLEHQWVNENCGKVTIRIKDSGEGFEYAHMLKNLHEDRRLYGRGIALVGQLCKSLRFDGKGNCVEAVYEWEKKAQLPKATLSGTG